MDITNEQSEELGSAIMLNDVLSYIENHQSEYETFLKNEQSQLKPKIRSSTDVKLPQAR